MVLSCAVASAETQPGGASWELFELEMTEHYRALAASAGGNEKVPSPEEFVLEAVSLLPEHLRTTGGFVEVVERTFAKLRRPRKQLVDAAKLRGSVDWQLALCAMGRDLGITEWDRHDLVGEHCYTSVFKTSEEVCRDNDAAGAEGELAPEERDPGEIPLHAEAGVLLANPDCDSDASGDSDSLYQCSARQGDHGSPKDE